MTILRRSLAPEHPNLEILGNPQRIDTSRSTAALVIHGYTATPTGMKSLVPPLVDAGFSVHVPALPGHGTHPLDMDGLTWQDWLQAVQTEYRQLRTQFDKVCVIGQSLGGAICTFLLQEQQPPDAAVLLATPWRIPDFSARLALPLLDLTTYKNSLIRLKKGGPDVADPQASSANTSYQWMTMASLCEVNKIIRMMRKKIASVSNPVLLIHSRNDHTAEYWGALKLKEKLGGQAVLITLEKSYHVLTEDFDRIRVARECAAFCLGGLNNS